MIMRADHINLPVASWGGGGVKPQHHLTSQFNRGGGGRPIFYELLMGLYFF